MSALSVVVPYDPMWSTLGGLAVALAIFVFYLGTQAALEADETTPEF